MTTSDFAVSIDHGLKIKEGHKHDYVRDLIII